MQASLGLMSNIAEQGQMDSMTLKILSVIATIYLPATLIAVKNAVSTKNQLMTVVNFFADHLQLQFDTIQDRRHRR